jgi:hypothetical protein
MTGLTLLLRSRWGLAILAATAAGLALRLLAARGGLWTDEAWSMVYAQGARTPAGVFLSINHDNNHHLYSLWLQAVGPGAAPLLVRLPAILAGTATILVAALFAARRSPPAAAVAAALFALAPILVHIGSEARGYAPMLLAAMLMLLLVDRWAAGEAGKRTALKLAALAAVGLLCHLTMLAAIGLALAFAYLAERSARGPVAALGPTLRLFGPALAATGAVLALVALAAAADPRGFSVGGYAPFAWSEYATALRDLGTYSLGIALAPVALAIVGAALAALLWALRRPLGKRALLFALLLFGTPLAIAVLQPGNAGFARYYLLTGAALLLLVAELAGWAFERRRGVLALAVVGGLLLVSLWRDAQLLAARHGDPDLPVAILKQRAPAGPSVALGAEGLRAVVAVAARRHQWPLRIAPGCAGAHYLLEPVGTSGAPPRERLRCGQSFERLAWAPVPPLSGQGWALYSARPLQSPRPPDSGPPPAR